MKYLLILVLAGSICCYLRCSNIPNTNIPDFPPAVKQMCTHTHTHGVTKPCGGLRPSIVRVEGSHVTVVFPRMCRCGSLI